MSDLQKFFPIPTTLNDSDDEGKELNKEGV